MYQKLGYKMMLFKKSLPVIFIILLSLFYNFPLKAAEQPTKADLESLTIPQIIERYQAPGQANLMIGKKILSINPKSAFKQFLTAGKYLKQGRDELVSMCAKQNQCFPEVIQENFQKLLDLAQADDQDAFSLLYRLGESKGIPVELSIRILDNLKPIYEKNPQLLLKTALEIASKDRRRGIHIIEILATKYNYSQAQLELGGCLREFF